METRPTAGAQKRKQGQCRRTREKAFPEGGRAKAPVREGAGRARTPGAEPPTGPLPEVALVPTGQVQDLVQPPRSDGRGHLGPGALSARPKPLDPIL